MSTATTSHKMFSAKRVLRNSAKIHREHQRRNLTPAQRAEREAAKAMQRTESFARTDKEQWHRMSPAEIVNKLGTDYETGLSEEQAAEYLERYGLNKLEGAKGKSILQMFVEELTNIIVIILMFAAFASIGFGEYVEGGVILAIVVINACVSVYQEANASDALAALASMSAPKADVIRHRVLPNGELEVVTRPVPSEHVVPGDVVVVTNGAIVPADVFVFESADLMVEEKSITGESTDVRKRGEYVATHKEEKKAVDGHAPDSDKKINRTRSFSRTASQHTLRSLRSEVAFREDGPLFRQHAAGAGHGAHGAHGGAEGKSNAKDVNHRPNMLWASSKVTNGNGRGVVVVTGMRTKVGLIARDLLKAREAAGCCESSDSVTDSDADVDGCFASCLRGEGTPLQRALHRMGVYMGLGALAICVIVFIVGTAIDHSDPSHGDQPTWLQMIMVAVSLAVSGVPEGLPACVTICLAMGMKEMVTRQCLVRTLPAVETLGSARVICSDKTGTLTAGEMTSKQIWVGGNTYDIAGNKYEIDNCPITNAATGVQPLSNNSNGKTSGPMEREKVLANILLLNLCNNATLQTVTKTNKKTGETTQEYEATGSSTERPFVVLGAKAGIWKQNLDSYFPRIIENAYSSSRKMMSTVHEVSPQLPFNAFGAFGINDPFLSCAKGAPNVLLTKCTRILGEDGRVRNLSEQDRANVFGMIDHFSDLQYRVLATAVKGMPTMGNYPETDEGIARRKADCEEGLIFVGLVASRDPPRPAVQNAILKARAAGVTTVMITGDYLNTAIAIAKHLGILPANITKEEASNESAPMAVDCRVLRQHDENGEPLLKENGDYVYISEEEIDHLVRTVRVFARAQPSDKLAIVTSMQDRYGLVAAMTGDGVNDAPALMKADIGVAMGITGTETAKQASDMVLTSDDFSAIVEAIEEGRVIYANIQKFVAFLLSTNFAEILVIFLAICVALPAPLQALQILFLNLCCDGLPALALSREKAEPGTMEEPPRPKSQEIIHSWMWVAIISNSIALMTAMGTVFIIGLEWHANGAYSDNHDEDGVERARTMVFICVTFAEYFRAFTVRSFRRPVWQDMFSNYVLLLCILASGSLLAVVLLVPGPMEIWGFQYCDGADWALAIGMALLPVLVTEITKAILGCTGQLTRKSLEGIDVQFAPFEKQLKRASSSSRQGGDVELGRYSSGNTFGDAKQQQQQQPQASWPVAMPSPQNNHQSQYTVQDARLNAIGAQPNPPVPQVYTGGQAPIRAQSRSQVVSPTSGSVVSPTNVRVSTGTAPSQPQRQPTGLFSNYQ